MMTIHLERVSLFCDTWVKVKGCRLVVKLPHGFRGKILVAREVDYMTVDGGTGSMALPIKLLPTEDATCRKMDPPCKCFIACLHGLLSRNRTKNCQEERGSGDGPLLKME